MVATATTTATPTPTPTSVPSIGQTLPRPDASNTSTAPGHPVVTPQKPKLLFGSATPQPSAAHAVPLIHPRGFRHSNIYLKHKEVGAIVAPTPAVEVVVPVATRAGPLSVGGRHARHAKMHAKARKGGYRN
jgi:hypothetical protein